jgi:PBSX family phage terminase large subunit
MSYNKNLLALGENLEKGQRGVILEGGSRSGKTWSSVDFIIYLCSVNNNITINVVKETYNGFKTTLYDDFRQRMAQFPKLAKYNVFEHVKEIPSFRIFNSRINFLGADQPSKFHGAGCDYFYINEALPIQRAIFDQLEMRCRSFWWMDFNPSVTDHWIFNILGKRDDVKFVHSTMLDNPSIGQWEKKKILGYEPIPENIEQGTADDYMWKVYGLGLRSSPQGLVFPNITWIDEFPENIERISYGLDFGFTNSPTALSKVGKDGQNLYIQKLFYAPTESSIPLAEAINSLKLDQAIWADSADKYQGGPGMINDLRMKGIKVWAVNKFAGSIIYGIDLMKQHKIHVVRDADARREFENYKWKEISGIRLNEPIDDFNHLLDSVRYAVLSSFRKG